MVADRLAVQVVRVFSRAGPGLGTASGSGSASGAAPGALRSGLLLFLRTRLGPWLAEQVRLGYTATVGFGTATLTSPMYHGYSHHNCKHVAVHVHARRTRPCLLPRPPWTSCWLDSGTQRPPSGARTPALGDKRSLHCYWPQSPAFVHARRFAVASRHLRSLASYP